MSRKKRVPLAKFRVHGWRSTLFFRVYIWKTLKEVREAYDKGGNKFSSRGCLAFVRTTPRYKINSNKTYKIKPIVGEIHFCAKALGTEVITHESTHAAVRLLERLKLDFAKLDGSHTDDGLEAEEILAHVVGHFAKQIVLKIYELKFLVEAKNGHKNNSIRRSSRRRKN